MPLIKTRSWLYCLSLVAALSGCGSTGMASADNPDLAAAIRDIVDHGQLDDYKYVAQRLGINIKVGPLETLSDPETHNYRGDRMEFFTDESITARFSVMPKDYRYGVSRASGGHRYRGGLSIYHLGSKGCIDETSMFKAFGFARPFPNPDAPAKIFRYSIKNEENYELNVIFEPVDTKCATSFSLFQNRLN
ncbi:conserved exported protein of unknown function [Caballeronia sp. S22]